jgi:hypothetical protein
VDGGSAIEAAKLRSSTRTHVDRIKRMEINPIRRQIEDLTQRTHALRGYL